MTSATDPPISSAFPPPEPTDTFPYRIEERIGSGSMGIVYRAVDVRLDRPVAIKTLRQAVLAEASSEDRKEMQARFQDEAKTAGRLSHPGITTVHSVGSEGGVAYFVMEWLEGKTLEDLIAERGRLPIGEAAHIIVALLDILAVAHRAGVVHRDVKPANILVLEDGRVKVTDFGIALAMEGDRTAHTKAGVVLATPKYASPEQLRSSQIDARSDLFSTGVVFYHLLTGDWPFEGKKFFDLANAILQKEPKPLRTYLADVPPAVEAVVRKALSKLAAERFADAEEMAMPLRELATAGDWSAVSSSSLPIAGRTGTGTSDHLPRVYRDLPEDQALAIVGLIRSWDGQELPSQPTQALLERLLDKPLHADAFAGALMVDGICLFIENATLWGAVNSQTGEQGDPVASRLPKKSKAVLYPVPAIYPPRFVSLLTSILHPPRRRQSDLDSTFINLPALAQKLGDEKFEGVLRFHRGPAYGLLFFVDGILAASLFSDGWNDVPIERGWVHWVEDYPVVAHVEERASSPLGYWYRHALKNLAVEVKILTGKDGDGDGGTTSSRIRELFKSPRGDASSRMVRLGIHPIDRSLSDVDYEQSPAYLFLTWMLKELPVRLAERGKTSHWRYLSEWLPMVQKALFYHELPRPESREEDFFDLVTTDENNKVLHVAERMAQSSEKGFKDFLDRVLMAKHSRVKTGDIGGAFLIAPEFDDDTLTIYDETIQGSMSGSLLGLGEALTGYEGFVRIGPRRGFHLLLVEETPDGGYEPLIPS